MMNRINAEGIISQKFMIIIKIDRFSIEKVPSILSLTRFIMARSMRPASEVKRFKILPEGFSSKYLTGDFIKLSTISI